MIAVAVGGQDIEPVRVPVPRPRIVILAWQFRRDRRQRGLRRAHVTEVALAPGIRVHRPGQHVPLIRRHRNREARASGRPWYTAVVTRTCDSSIASRTSVAVIGFRFRVAKLRVHRSVVCPLVCEQRTHTGSPSDRARRRAIWAHSRWETIEQQGLRATGARPKSTRTSLARKG